MTIANFFILNSALAASTGLPLNCKAPPMLNAGNILCNIHMKVMNRVLPHNAKH